MRSIIKTPEELTLRDAGRILRKRRPEISRQRRWQINRYRAGRCINCGEKREESTYKYHCMSCGKTRVRKNSRLRGIGTWAEGKPGRPPKWAPPKSTSL